MCAFHHHPPSLEYINDMRRGRIAEPSRFYELAEYAKRRWERSRNPKHYTQWQKLMEAVERRRPR